MIRADSIRDIGHGVAAALTVVIVVRWAAGESLDTQLRVGFVAGILIGLMGAIGPTGHRHRIGSWGDGARMKALGITAMIFAIVAIFVPILGPYLTLVGAFLAAFAAGPGVTFAIVAILVNLLNVFFLSPSLWLAAGMMEAGEAGAGGAILASLGMVFLGAQVVAAIVLALMHQAWKSRQTRALVRSQ